jgi:hypothetical protein
VYSLDRKRKNNAIVRSRSVMAHIVGMPFCVYWSLLSGEGGVVVLGWDCWFGSCRGGWRRAGQGLWIHRMGGVGG